VLIAAGVRRLTKLVLFPVRFLYTAATGRVGTNDAAAAWYLIDRSFPTTNWAITRALTAGFRASKARIR
jgi:hypothetical protein